MGTELKAVAVITEDGQRIDMVDLANQPPWTCRVQRVVWQNGSTAWGKTWWDAETGLICRVGAGAYGDMTVWRRT